jgi:hypothetical protein
MATAKPRELQLVSGKSEFHRFRTSDGDTVEPCCSCKHNVDFNTGCISNANPYFLNGDEIFSGRVLELPRQEVFNRRDQRLSEQMCRLEPGLFPDIRLSDHFPQELKDKVWSILEQCIHYYQNNPKYSVMPERKKFDSFFQNGIGLLDGKSLYGCQYCYARYKNDYQTIIPKNISFSRLERQIKSLWEQGHVVVDEKGNQRLFARIGKSVECASVYHLNALLHLLELGAHYGVGFYLPTKHLYFDESIAELLKTTDSSLSFSLSYEHLERGVVLHGFDNDYRMHCAKRYADAGVRTALNVTHDCTASFDDTQKQGSHIYEVAEFLKKNPDIGRQLIPIRMHRLELIEKVTGIPKKVLVDGWGNEGDAYNMFRSFEASCPRCHPDGTNKLLPLVIHPDYEAFFSPVKNPRAGICADIGGTFMCNSCFFPDMPHEWELDNEALIPVVSLNTQKRHEKRRRKEEREQELMRAQQELEF